MPATLKVEIVGSGSMVLPRPAVLSNVKPVVDAPKLTPATRFPARRRDSLRRPQCSDPRRSRRKPRSGSRQAGWRPNHAVEKRRCARRCVRSRAFEEDRRLSGRDVRYAASATAEPNEFELSSIFQPVMLTALVLVFVTSNQSAI